MFNLKKERIQLKELLGKGSFGRVYPYQKNKDDKAWAIKILIASDEEQLIKIFEEIVLGFSCDHPNIAPIKGYHIEKMDTQDYKVYLKLPRMVETLKQKIERDTESYSEERIVKYFYSLICGLEYLHKKKIAHRDVKSTNIMFSQEGEIKLCDVGVARLVTENESVGALASTAPEIMDKCLHLKKKDLFKADAWSLGLVIAELCLKQKDIYNFKESSLEKREKQLIEKVRELKEKYSERLLSLLFGLLDFNPEKRKSIEETKKLLEENYPLVKEVDDENHPKENQSGNEIERFPDVQEKILRLQKELEERFEGKVQFDGARSCKINSLREIQFENSMKSLFQLNLEKLSIAWEKRQATDLEIKIFGECISHNLKSLQHLHLNFDNCRELTDDAFQSLAVNIGNNLKSLEHLHLNFNYCQSLKDPGVQSLAMNIGYNLQSLQHLYLNFDNGYITGKGVESLAVRMCPNLKSLQHLDLSFAGVPDIDDDGVQSLAVNIGKYLKSLQHLHLNFSLCRYLTDNAVQSLAEHIGNNLKCLEHLYLNFNYCEKTTDNAVQSVAEHIGNNLKSLQHLYLNFNRCKNLTDNGVLSLTEHIGNNLKCLEHLYLSFSYSEITDNGVLKIVEHLGNILSSIEHFTFESYRTGLLNAQELIQWVPETSE